MSNHALPVRRSLRHDVPAWVEDGALFFITVNCARRGCEKLTLSSVATALLESARFYHEQKKWHLHLLLLMPDHWHAIMSFPRSVVMADALKHWKRFTAQRCGINWQDGFFDHRLRSEGEVNEKHHYIRLNPVRQGLCGIPEEWPHQLHSTPNGLASGAW